MVSRRRQDFLDQQLLTARPAWKKQTPTTAETTGVIIARVSISKPMRKRPDTGALLNCGQSASGSDLGRLDLQDPAEARNRDRPRLHGLWDLAHEVDVQEPVL